MAEALGVASGIAGILSLTVQITKTIVQFGLEWKNAPKEVQSLMNELQSLKTILSETQTNLIFNADFTDAFQDRPSILLSELGPNAPPTTETKLSITCCKKELESLLDDLKKREKGHRIGWERFKAPFCAKSLQKSIDTVSRRCQNLNEMISIDTLTVGVHTLGEVKQARKEQQVWYDAQENQKILEWLSNLSFEEKHRDIFSKHQSGTGKWFLELDEFKAWRNQDPDKSSTIWCTGIPGAGKSVMTSIVIEHLRETFVDEEFLIAYVYCDYKDNKRQTAASLLGCLVKQMVIQQEEMPKEISDLYKKKSKAAPSVEDSVSLLSSLMSGSKRSFVLVDALDEHFTNEDEESMSDLTFLNKLLQLQHQVSVQGYSLFLTSREQPIFQERLAKCIRAEIYAENADIENYLHSRIYDDTKFSFASKMLEDAELARTILESLSRKAQGMFLLPRLHLDRLSCQTSVRGLRKALESLPSKLDETYNEAITRIRGQVPEHCELAMSALSWISHALRPLKVGELVEALAVKPGDQELDLEGLPDIALIVSSSAGLITIDDESQEVRLVHFTVEEYFKQMKVRLFPDADLIVAQTCITYLSFIVSKDNRSSDAFSSFDEYHNLLDYANENWGNHLRGESECALEHQVLGFLSSERHLHYPSLMFEDTYSDAKYSALHLIVYFDLRHILKIYLNGDLTSDIENGSFFTSLHLAIYYGHEEIAKLLLAREDIDVNGLNKHQRTPLSVAAEVGTVNIVSMLLERDKVSADSKDDFGITPLTYAADAGHEGIVRMLINRDHVDADSKNFYNRTPLLLAAWEGHEGIVRMLINRDDVEVDHQDICGRTPLWYAARYGRKTTVKLLLEHGDVEPDREDEDGMTPISIAREWERIDIAELIEEEIARRRAVGQGLRWE